MLYHNPDDVEDDDDDDVGKNPPMTEAVVVVDDGEKELWRLLDEMLLGLNEFAEITGYVGKTLPWY